MSSAPASSHMGTPPKLMEDGSGLVFEYLDEKEAEFLYEAMACEDSINQKAMRGVGRFQVEEACAGVTFPPSLTPWTRSQAVVSDSLDCREMFIRRSYLRHGVSVEDGALVLDVGANLGLFSLQCLREANGVQVVAFEPIPPIYEVLVRNLRHFERTRAGVGPKPVSLRVAVAATGGQGDLVYYPDKPGESTRYPDERKELRDKLLSDKHARAWRRALSCGGPFDQPAIRGSDRACTARTDTGASDVFLDCVASEGSRAFESPPSTSPTIASEGQGSLGRSPKPEGGVADEELVLSSAIAHQSHAPSPSDVETEGSLDRASKRRKQVPEGLPPVTTAAETTTAPVEGRERLRLVSGGDRVEDGMVVGRDVEATGSNQEVESFSCSTVTLSLALEKLEIARVDLLKIDVEGDELTVLEGISSSDWPKIRQVVLEVHDIDGRLSSVVDMLRSEAAGFEHVCWEAQETSEVGGYVMVLPRALRMFLVFARRVAKAGGDCGRCAENYGSGIGPREGAGGRDGVGDQPDAMRSSSCCCHRSPTL